MNASRYGLFTGLLVCLPVSIWLLMHNPVQLNGSEWQTTTLLSVKALYITLAIAVAIFIPWHASSWQWKENLESTTLLILISLPVMSIAWLSAAISTEILIRGLTGIFSFSVAILVLTKAIDLLKFTSNTKSVLRVSIQIILASIAWSFSNLWLPWLGL